MDVMGSTIALYYHYEKDYDKMGIDKMDHKTIQDHYKALSQKDKKKYARTIKIEIFQPLWNLRTHHDKVLSEYFTLTLTYYTDSQNII